MATAHLKYFVLNFPSSIIVIIGTRSKMSQYSMACYAVRYRVLSAVTVVLCLLEWRVCSGSQENKGELFLLIKFFCRGFSIFEKYILIIMGLSMPSGAKLPCYVYTAFWGSLTTTFNNNKTLY